MARKEHHTTDIGISIIGSRVAGQATGIGLFTHGHNLVSFDIDKRSLEDLRERRYTTAETIYEAVQRSDISMILVPIHGRQVCRPPLCQGNPGPTEKSKPSRP